MRGYSSRNKRIKTFHVPLWIYKLYKRKNEEEGGRGAGGGGIPAAIRWKAIPRIKTFHVPRTDCTEEKTKKKREGRGVGWGVWTKKKKGGFGQRKDNSHGCPFTLLFFLVHRTCWCDKVCFTWLLLIWNNFHRSRGYFVGWMIVDPAFRLARMRFPLDGELDYLFILKNWFLLIKKNDLESPLIFVLFLKGKQNKKEKP